MAGVSDKKDIVLLDVAPLSLGIENHNGEVVIVVPRNTTIPTRKVTKRNSAVDNQTKVSFPVYEGERLQATNNNFLGEFHLYGVPPVRKGVPEFDVWFDIDANGILTASAEDVNTGNTNQITVTNQSRFSKEEVDRLIEECKKYHIEDARYKRKLKAKNDIQNYADHISEHRLTSEDMSVIKVEIDKALEWLNWNDDTKDILIYENKLKELKDFCGPIIAHSSDFFVQEAKMLEARNALENYANKIWATLLENEHKLAWEDIVCVEVKIKNAMVWLNSNNDVNDALEYKNKLKELQDFCGPILAVPSKSLVEHGKAIVGNIVSHFKPNSQDERNKQGTSSVQEKDTNSSEMIRKEVEHVEEMKKEVLVKMANLGKIVEEKVAALVNAQGLGSSSKETTITTTLSGKEVRAEILKVPGMLPDHELKAVKIFMKCPDEFEMLKDLPEEKKLEWVLLHLEG